MYFSDTLIHNAGQVYLTYLSQLAIFFLNFKRKNIFKHALFIIKFFITKNSQTRTRSCDCLKIYI